jgi:hypothetical protein
VQSNLPDALAVYRDSLVIRKRLAIIDPANEVWQIELAGALWRVGRAGDDPHGNYSSAISIIRRHDDPEKLTPNQKDWLIELQREISGPAWTVMNVIYDRFKATSRQWAISSISGSSNGRGLGIMLTKLRNLVNLCQSTRSFVCTEHSAQ